MSDFLKSLGRMLVFSLILPGIIGCVAILALFPGRFINTDSSMNILFLYIFFIGFVANAFGYLIDILIQLIACWPKNFLLFLRNPYKSFIPKYTAKVIKQRLVDDYDFLYCESTCYLNTSIILLIILLVRHYDFLKSVLCYIIKASNDLSASTFSHSVTIFLGILAAILFILYIVTRRHMYKLLDKM